MDANQIRAFDWDQNYLPEKAGVLILQEIAAQLAELNVTLNGFIQALVDYCKEEEEKEDANH